METHTRVRDIQWKQLLSLIILDIAIILSWIAYTKYQPNLVQQFGFGKFALILAIVQGIILVVTPPIAGSVADRVRKTSGKRLPVINIGINVVSMVFMAVAVTIFAKPTGFITLIFPVLIVLWLISMNIFHSPAISMVETFVPVERLPSVMAVFVMLTEITYAIEPSINDLMEFFGAALTFVVGGLLVFGSGWMLQRSSLSLPSTTQTFSKEQPEEKSNFGLVILTGLIMGIATTVFFNIFPDYLQSKISFLKADGFKGSYYVSLLAAFAALISIPVGRWIERYGLIQAAQIGYISILILTIGILYIPQPQVVLVLSLLYPIAFSILSVSAFPLVFDRLSPAHKVLGVGLFFSGVELPNSLMDILQVMGQMPSVGGQILSFSF